MTWNEKFTHAPNMIGYTATIIEEMIVINKMKTTEWGDSGTGSSQGGGWGETSPLRGLSPRPSGSERFALCDVWSGMDTHLATHTTTLPLLLCGHVDTTLALRASTLDLRSIFDSPHTRQRRRCCCVNTTLPSPFGQAPSGEHLRSSIYLR